MRRNRATLTAILVLAAAAASQDPARDLRSRDVAVQLAALETVRTTADVENAKGVVKLLDDKDWEVAERAADVLGHLGAPVARAAVSELVEASLEGATGRLRRASARALGRVDPQAGAEALAKQLRGRGVMRALTALTIVLHGHPDPAAALEVLEKPLDKLRRHKEAAVKRAVERARFPLNPDRTEGLETLITRDIEGACAALDMMTDSPRASDLPVLQGLLEGGERKAVVDRRLRAAAVAACAASDDPKAAAKSLLQALGKVGPAAPRRARLIPRLFARGALTHDIAVALLDGTLRGRDQAARSAAAKALRAVGGEAAGKVAMESFESQNDPRVRMQLVETVVATLDVRAAEQVEWLCERAGDQHPWVRERATVALGRSGNDAAVPTLTRRLDDGRWGIGACAAVSLGMTRADDAVPVLLERAKNEDWRHRGAAIVGLVHLNRRESVPALLDALKDDVPLVARSAHEGLERIADMQMPMKPRKWREFWDERLDGFVFRDWQRMEENRKKYGYDVADAEIYRGLDVLVFTSRGDHIENLLDKLEIEHRTTTSGEVHEAAPHPGAICVVNCTGEMEARDREALRWFVMTGGALFGSCWALSETIAHVYPGVMGKARTPGQQVLDQVRAFPCHESAFLTGVFPEGVRPIYHLEGAHLIRVDDPERAEVLIDSPECASRHDSGNLAAWFRAGHGLIMDSVNHFDLQGFAGADDLKKADQRQAWAIDHMALSYERWREIRKQGFWRNTERAADEVPDLSAFRFLTNFVRAVRIGAER